MKKLILIGRSECGKTTLKQALKKEELRYEKTQYVEYGSCILDTPGEYIENRNLGGAVALYAYEADVVGLVVSATEPYSLLSPNITSMANREVIGIVTKIDQKNANPKRVAKWLELAGCKKIFFTSSYQDIGIDELIEYLN
ncbi:ethanolamine utilization protein EutP [Sporanaerobium hydrogeniformans]|uniref:Ethanolamine utilization protein EutP n=1 Tax=Sporanaerobium hydrogeniformans TaxID=3072179 RepID=A0AC61DBV7_9FIRM|nr:EutP/PduV family microcompartment system protein [Sporanaerobium hydrogeniformans]PHV70270.1 ethanolamine utilization protein EutP [Sporanaerobium hydrogeniformans]